MNLNLLHRPYELSEIRTIYLLLIKNNVNLTDVQTFKIQFQIA